eukprot:Mrub_11768.p1 GENE.Mrub_11768~~Mrub_11768.p1  ORF type:complete len:184 (-),score=52.09 Mrub_11768:48-533(-)
MHQMDLMDIEKESRDTFIKLFKDNLNNKYNPQDQAKMEHVYSTQDQSVYTKADSKWLNSNSNTTPKAVVEKEYGDDEDEFDDKMDGDYKQDDLSELNDSYNEEYSNCNIYGMYKFHKFNKQKIMKMNLENIIFSMNGYEMCFKDVRINAHWLEDQETFDET